MPSTPMQHSVGPVMGQQHQHRYHPPSRNQHSAPQDGGAGSAETPVEQPFNGRRQPDSTEPEQTVRQGSFGSLPSETAYRSVGLVYLFHVLSPVLSLHSPSWSCKQVQQQHWQHLHLLRRCQPPATSAVADFSKTPAEDAANTKMREQPDEEDDDEGDGDV
ncbi:hypothetical protein BYT27DRAFT_7260889 [Phlegmacium glaucopus]|nr:hypothetical protein BYT27DRAFT_7260889 [Phlegmacium glaucopus]